MEAAEIQHDVDHPVEILSCSNIGVEHKTFCMWFLGTFGKADVWIAVR